jgi:hypothetical protein
VDGIAEMEHRGCLKVKVYRKDLEDMEYRED